MAHQYLVDLTDEQQEYRHDVIRKGNTTARRVARAPVLLRAAPGATEEDIAHPLQLGIASVPRIRQRFVADGGTAAVSERARAGAPPVWTGKQATFRVAGACRTRPAGRPRWTLKLGADRVVALRPIDRMSPATVGRVLQNTSSSPGNGRKGAVPG